MIARCQRRDGDRVRRRLHLAAPSQVVPGAALVTWHPRPPPTTPCRAWLAAAGCAARMQARGGASGPLLAAPASPQGSAHGGGGAQRRSPLSPGTPTHHGACRAPHQPAGGRWRRGRPHGCLPVGGGTHAPYDCRSSGMGRPTCLSSGPLPVRPLRRRMGSSATREASRQGPPADGGAAPPDAPPFANSHPKRCDSAEGGRGRGGAFAVTSSHTCPPSRSTPLTASGEAGM